MASLQISHWRKAQPWIIDWTVYFYSVAGLWCTSVNRAQSLIQSEHTHTHTHTHTQKTLLTFLELPLYSSSAEHLPIVQSIECRLSPAERKDIARRSWLWSARPRGTAKGMWGRTGLPRGNLKSADHNNPLPPHIRWPEGMQATTHLCL